MQITRTANDYGVLQPLPDSLLADSLRLVDYWTLFILYSLLLRDVIKAILQPQLQDVLSWSTCLVLEFQKPLRYRQLLR